MPTRSNLGAKDFELVAAVLHDANPLYITSTGKYLLALDFADRLVSTSDSFDPTRFISACGLIADRNEITEQSTALRLRVEALEARRSPR